MIYGFGGLVVPFVGIKLIDVLINALHRLMEISMLAQLRPAVVLLILLTVITGIAYPLAVTGVAGLLAPDKANGSLVVRDGQVIGLQPDRAKFTGANYFNGRPSAAGADGYDAGASSGSISGRPRRRWSTGRWRRARSPC